MLIIGALSGAWLSSGGVTGAALVGVATGLGLSAASQAVAGGGSVGTAAGAAAGAASASSIIGAKIGGDAISALSGGLGAVAVSLPASWVLASSGLMSGPLGYLLVGASTEDAVVVSLDCWKPVLRDASSCLSQGRLLRELAADPRVAEVAVRAAGCGWPEVRLLNVWGDAFHLSYVQLPGDGVAAHAELLAE